MRSPLRIGVVQYSSGDKGLWCEKIISLLLLCLFLLHHVVEMTPVALLVWGRITRSRRLSNPTQGVACWQGAGKTGPLSKTGPVCQVQRTLKVRRTQEEDLTGLKDLSGLLLPPQGWLSRMSRISTSSSPSSRVFSFSGDTFRTLKTMLALSGSAAG